MSKERAAGLFLVNREDKILVGHPTRHNPNFWSIPKGKLDEGETPLQAAVRETYEESNVKLFCDLHDFVELGKFVYRHKKKDIVLFAHFETKTANWADRLHIRCNSNVPEEKGGFPEMDAFKWVTIDEARGILHETQVAALDLLEDEIEKFRNQEIGIYPTLWCNDCNKFTMHLNKLSAVMAGYRVCDKCARMNPVCSLSKFVDGVEVDNRTSNEVNFVEYGDDGLYKDIHKDYAVGRCCLMGPSIKTSYAWLTTQITEIIEEGKEGLLTTLTFKTENSIYKLKFHKL